MKQGFGGGGDFGRQADFGDFEAPKRRPKAESRRGGAKLDRRGGAVFRTVIQDYDSRSDYRRWRSGLSLAAAMAPGGRYTRRFESTPLRDFGPRPQVNRYELTALPSSTPGRVSWSVVRLLRGSWILPQVLDAADLSIVRPSKDASEDRLVLSVGATLTASQLGEWQSLVGYQFENSAAPSGDEVALLDEPEDAIAYTLVEVDAEALALRFDLSRPYRRVRPTLESTRKFWSRRAYDRERPILWNTSEQRYLVSSDYWHCDCPDHSGITTAVIGGLDAAPPTARFPLPSAQSDPLNPWEKSVAGYRARFRELDFRSDRRRACKHVHADRWRSGLPFYEPADYPFLEAERQFSSGGDLSLLSGDLFRFHGRQGLELDSAVVAIAEALGILVDTRELAAETAEEAPVERRPILWTSRDEPLASLARVDDWWLRRGTKEVKAWDPAHGGSWSNTGSAPRLLE